MAIVTGGARGIGFAVAQAAASLATGSAGPFTASSAGARVRTGRVGVTDESAVAEAAEDALAAYGPIDILINSAGITGPNHPLWEYPTGRLLAGDAPLPKLP